MLRWKNKKVKLLLVFFLLVFLFSLILLILFISSRDRINKIKTFEDCAKAGFPISLSYPAVCHTSDGRSFSQQLTPQELEKIRPPIYACQNRCGDGICQQVVCMGTNCPCSENFDTCPRDCSDKERLVCTSDSDCQKGFSCWYKIPVGATEGIRGSKENPGRCWSDETINLML